MKAHTRCFHSFRTGNRIRHAFIATPHLMEVMSQLHIYDATALVVLAYVLEYLFVLRDHKDEPRRLKSKVALIGHILGLIRSGPSCHSDLR